MCEWRPPRRCCAIESPVWHELYSTQSCMTQIETFRRDAKSSSGARRPSRSASKTPRRGETTTMLEGSSQRGNLQVGSGQLPTYLLSTGLTMYLVLAVIAIGVGVSPLPRLCPGAEAAAHVSSRPETARRRLLARGAGPRWSAGGSGALRSVARTVANFAGECHQRAVDQRQDRAFESALEHSLQAAGLLGLDQGEQRGRVVEAILAEVRRLFAEPAARNPRGPCWR